jgi:metal-responsive CopG/Arc/MetJ family transcriptional regulator
MKTKTSITLSQDILRAIDAHMGAYRSRSDFIETAARVFIEHLEKKEAELHDLEISINMQMRSIMRRRMCWVIRSLYETG